MFQQFYGFSRTPFSKDIPPQDLFPAEGQQELCARLTYLVKERGLGLVTGETGSGKSTALRRFVASLGIQRIHAAPYHPEGKGKIERMFETTRLQFMPEVEASEITTLAELNESLWAWLECVYHTTTWCLVHPPRNRADALGTLPTRVAGGAHGRSRNLAQGFSLARDPQGAQRWMN
jgi:transposase InsO family protein